MGVGVVVAVAVVEDWQVESSPSQDDSAGLRRVGNAAEVLGDKNDERTSLWQKPSSG